MERDIKFRGSDGDRWYYGDLEYCRKTDIARIHTYNSDGLYEGQHIVDPSSVGQFTGIHDKNGKEIYEGDVLSVCVFDCFGNDTLYDVRIGWEDCNFVGTDVEDDYYAWDLGWLRNQDDEMEIIGNIYEDTSDKETREG